MRWICVFHLGGDRWDVGGGGVEWSCGCPSVKVVRWIHLKVSLDKLSSDR